MLHYSGVRLDRNVFAKQTPVEAAEHRGHYQAMSEQERGRSFRYLMQVSYGFLGKGLAEDG